MFRTLATLISHEWFDSASMMCLHPAPNVLFGFVIKDIEEVWSYSDKEYSQMNSNGYMGGRSGRMMPMYGRSYVRGNRNMMDGGYSRNSNNKDMMINHLQDVMDMAVDEKDRKAISRLIEQMEQN